MLTKQRKARLRKKITARKDRECPCCHKKAFTEKGQKATIARGKRAIDVYLQCDRCGKLVCPAVDTKTNRVLLITQEERELIRHGRRIKG